MNILYGVPGEGMGHATRSKVIIDFLLNEKHNVIVVSSSRAFKFLDQVFPGRVIEIRGFHFAYRNAQVSKTGTFLLNLKSAAGNFVHNFRKKLLVEKTFSPDLVISDFESFSWLFAKQHRLPIISIDNMQVMDRCKLNIPVSNERSNYRLARRIVHAKVPACDHYLISSFFDAEVKKKNTAIVPAIIRQQIIDAKVSDVGHVLMYQTSSNLSTVQQTLVQLPGERFIVYGMNRDAREKNVIYRSFSEAGFIEDLASSKAVIANGGFSFISEAVYLKKPVYSFPLQNQFEQYMNAAYIQKLGYGRHFDDLDPDKLKAFIYDLQVFKTNLATYRQRGNEVLFSKLNELLLRLAKTNDRHHAVN
jgi:uncharacterized protein (TIGR00661 family)